MKLEDVVNILENKIKKDTLKIHYNDKSNQVCFNYVWFTCELRETILGYTHLILTPYSAGELTELADMSYKATFNLLDDKQKFPNIDKTTGNIHPVNLKDNEEYIKLIESIKNKKSKLNEFMEIKINQIVLSKPHNTVSDFGPKENKYKKEIKQILPNNKEGVINYYPIAYCPSINSKEKLSEGVIERFFDDLIQYQ